MITTRDTILTVTTPPVWETWTNPAHVPRWMLARDAALRTGMKDGVEISFDRLAASLRQLS